MAEKDKQITSLQQQIEKESKTRDNAISLVQSNYNFMINILLPSTLLITT